MTLEDKIIEALENSGQRGKLLSPSELVKRMCAYFTKENYKKGVQCEAVFVKNENGKVVLYNPYTGERRSVDIFGSEELLQYGENDRIVVQLNCVQDNAPFGLVWTAEFLDYICDVREIQGVLDKLEKEGKFYSTRGLYREFPTELGYVQGSISINERQEGFVKLTDGSEYMIHPNDMDGVLAGDTVVAVPTNRMYRGYRMAKVDKIIERKDGLLTVEVVSKKKKKAVVSIGARMDRLILDGVDLDELEVGTKLQVQVKTLDLNSTYHVQVLGRAIETENVEVVEEASDIVDSKDEEMVKVYATDKELVVKLAKKFFRESNEKKYTLSQIQRNLSKQVLLSTEDLVQVLSELELDGMIYCNKGFYSAFPRNLGYVQASIHLNKYDEGIVELEDGRKYKVEPQGLNDALDGDLVVLNPLKMSKNGFIIAKVEKIVERKDGLVVVEVVKDEVDGYCLRPFNARLNHIIKINNSVMKPLVEGDRIVVKIDELSDKGIYYAEFVKNIGHKDDPDADLQVIAIENNIVVEFTGEALNEANEAPDVVSEEEKVGRLDLTDKLIFTIDGAKTKDRDDAVSIEMNEKGNYIVGVHISDVTHYVHPGMKLWEEALSRATSVYMADTVIPMIPHKLSNGICSLNEDVDRLTVSCIMEVSPNGDILNYDFKDSIINSRKAMVYDDVNKLLENGEIVEGYEEFYDALEMMRKLSARLEKKKEKRGYVNFGSNDVEIVKDEDGKPIDFIQREQRTAEKIIENLMLLANECYATYVVIPTPLRVHECPDEEKVAEAFETLDKSGIRVRTVGDIVNGRVIQQILGQIDDMDERKVAAQIILRSMQRARYDVERIGHFGLGLKNYGHFTSPIRRAADLRGHYNLKMQRDNTFEIKDIEEFHEMMASFCNHISRKERNADKAEHEANEFKMIQYMADHLGEKFHGRVTFISGKTIYVKTDQGIDGRLYPRDIKGDYFTYNDQTLSFVGKNSKRRIKIGSHLVLTALDADRDFGSISFGIEEEDIALIKSRKRGVK